MTEVGGGRVGYVYLPDTSTEGHEFMKRYFFPQAARQALIIDERFNRGGQYADYVLDLLTRTQGADFGLRWGAALPTPGAVISGPKVMIINESSGSGGDLLPWAFRRFDVGTLVGARTWGGLVGLLGLPPADGRGPRHRPQPGRFRRDPLDRGERGRDARPHGPGTTPRRGGRRPRPSTETAIQLALEGLAAVPPTTVTLPPYPVKEP